MERKPLALRLSLVAVAALVALGLAGCGAKPGDQHTAAAESHQTSGGDSHGAATDSQGAQAASDGHGHGTAAKPTLPAGVRPVQYEMQALGLAYGNMIQRVLLKQFDGLHDVFAEVDARRQLTVEALEKGQIELPKNGDKLKEFVELDDQFHAELLKLIHAAEEQDQAAAIAQSKKLLDMGVQCHTEYRE